MSDKLLAIKTAGDQVEYLLNRSDLADWQRERVTVALRWMRDALDDPRKRCQHDLLLPNATVDVSQGGYAGHCWACDRHWKFK